MAENFSDMVAAERDRFTKLLLDIDAKIDSLKEEAQGYKRELSALDAYEATRAGKPARAVASTTRAQRGSRQETLLALLSSNPTGMTRSEVLDELGVKGNRAQEGAISNALTTMKKVGKIISEDGRYRPA